MPTASAIMPVYNGEAYVAKAIGSIDRRLISQTPIRFANLAETLLLYRRRDNAAGAIRDRQNRGEVRDRFRRMLLHSGHEAPAATLDRFMRLRRRKRRAWAERRRAKREIQRLINCIIERKRDEPGDKAKLLAAMNKRLELSSPRIWRMYRHCRRHRFWRPGA